MMLFVMEKSHEILKVMQRKLFLQNTASLVTVLFKNWSQLFNLVVPQSGRVYRYNELEEFKPIEQGIFCYKSISTRMSLYDRSSLYFFSLFT